MNLQDLEQKHILKTYNRFPLHFKSGRGATLKDNAGKNYIDFLSGIGVNALGYGHPVLKNAARHALNGIIHTSNLFLIETQILLAKEIQSHFTDSKTFFANSGTEANEAAFKLAAKYGKSVKPEKTEMVSIQGSFHGRTMGSLALTAQEKYQNAFKPFPGVQKVIKINDEMSLDAITDKTAAVFIEPIQGESGVRPLSENFMRAVREKCYQYQALLIADEVQCGCSRTGKVFAFEHYDIEIDGFTLAKGLGGGVPIGAFTIQNKYSKYLVPGDHASTFGGGPFITETALAVFKEITSEGFLKQVNEKSELFFSYMRRLKKDFSVIKEIRGKGLMLAIEFESDKISANELMQKCMEGGLIVNAIDDKIIRMLPPLVISRGEIKKGFSILAENLETLAGQEA